jgi:hypothetical protein
MLSSERPTESHASDVLLRPMATDAFWTLACLLVLSPDATAFLRVHPTIRHEGAVGALSLGRSPLLS